MNSQNTLTIPLAIVVAGALIGGAVLYTKNDNKSSRVQEEEARTITVNPVTANDHILGSPSAPIKIVEFSDIECPFCKVFHGTMNALMNEYGKSGKVAWVYRHYPIPQLHKNAMKEAEATECAAEQGGNTKFWEYTNQIFARTPSNDGLDMAELPRIAENIGLDVEAFNVCLASGKYISKIQDHIADGVRAGISGTPSSVIVTSNGTTIPVSGAQPYSVMKQTIDALIASGIK